MDLSDSIVPAGWHRRSIEDVCRRVTSGGTPSRKTPEFYVGGTWPWVKTQELQDGWLRDTEEHINDDAVQRSSAKVLPKNSILLAMYGATVGKLGLLSREMTCNQACCALIVDEAIADYRFVFYLLLTYRSRLQNLAVGAAQQNLSGTTIKSFRFSFPPLHEQRAIASILGALDDKIELNRKMSATLEAMARALFKSWFVDYDPVRAKLEARSTGLSSAIADLFPDSFEKSERGDIPNGWCLSRLSTISASIQRGVSPIYTDAGILVINQKCIRDGHIDLSKARRHDSLTKSVKGRIAQRGDVLVNSTGVGTLGRVAPVVALHAVEATVDSHVTMVRADPTAVNPTYLGSAMLHLQPEIETMGEGSTGQTELSRVRLGGLIIVTSPRSIQERFAYLVEPLFLKVAANGQESGTLSALRNALLPKLISGELRVSEAERILEMSA